MSIETYEEIIGKLELYKKICWNEMMNQLVFSKIIDELNIKEIM